MNKIRVNDEVLVTPLQKHVDAGHFKSNKPFKALVVNIGGHFAVVQTNEGAFFDCLPEEISEYVED